MAVPKTDPLKAGRASWQKPWNPEQGSRPALAKQGLGVLAVVDQIKAQVDLSAIVGRRVKLRKAGHELVGLCPFHAENTPSFRVNDTKGVYHCFGCGASGDLIDYVQVSEGLSFKEAVAWLANGDALATVDPGERQQRARVERADRSAAVLAAQAQWHEARGVVGTPAERYLTSRGIVGPMPATIRFGRVPLWRDKKTGADGRPFPALIAACQNAAGKIVGVQRIYLTESGQKARMTNPKYSLGQVRGCAVRFGPPGREIMLCEGPEDGLTLHQRHPQAYVWVSLGTGGLPFVELPAEIEAVTIAGDNNAAGRAAVARGVAAFEAQGRTVRAVYPAPQFKDWNDELMGVVMDAPA